MALQILPAGTPRRNLAAEFAGNFTSGLMESGISGLEKKKAQSLLAKEDAALKSKGIDLTGITDPKMRQQALVQALKTKGQREIKSEENKFLTELFSGKNEKINPKSGLEKGEQEKNIDIDKEEQSVEDETQDYSQFTDEDIARAEIMRHGLGTTLGSLKSSKQKQDVGKQKEVRRQFEADRSYHSKTSDPVLESANAVLKEEPIKKGLNAQLRRDIVSGNTSGIFPFLVDRLGLESFRNPESARFTSEIKNKFVASLSDIPGARPNMFLERVLSTAQPQIGRSEEANLSVLDLADFVDDLNYERARQIRNISKEDRRTLGYVRNDVEERAEDRMGNFANKRQDQMAYDIRKRHEDAIEDDADLLNEIIGKDIPEGTPVTRRVMRLLMIKNKDDAKKAVKEAKSLGMIFPNKETYERHEN